MVIYHSTISMLPPSSRFPISEEEKVLNEDEVTTSVVVKISILQIGELYFFISLYPLTYLTVLSNSLITNGRWSDV